MQRHRPARNRMTMYPDLHGQACKEKRAGNIDHAITQAHKQLRTCQCPRVWARNPTDALARGRASIWGTCAQMQAWHKQGIVHSIADLTNNPPIQHPNNKYHWATLMC
eukprot:13268475-Alexandrium_andersonii.AAC.1